MHRFTMHGAPEDPGIIPRAFDHIFKRATAIEEECSDTFAIKISFLEMKTFVYYSLFALERTSEGQ